MFAFFLISILFLPVIIGLAIYGWNRNVNENGYAESPSPVKYLITIVVVDVLLGLVFTWIALNATIPNGKCEIREGKYCIVDSTMYCNGDENQVFTLFLEDRDRTVSSTDMCSLCRKWYINHYNKNDLETIQNVENILCGWIP